MLSLLLSFLAGMVLWLMQPNERPFLQKLGLSYLATGLLFFSFIAGIKSADAKEFKLLEHQETSLNIKNYFPNGHNPLMPEGSILNKGLDLDLKTDLLRYGYWNNKVWSLADQHQFRWIGWNYQFGIRILPFLDVEYEHFSKHILDKQYQYKTQGRFPVEDSVNVKLYLYRKDKADSLIK
jgi:hypothetical protein